MGRGERGGERERERVCVCVRETREREIGLHEARTFFLFFNFLPEQLTQRLDIFPVPPRPTTHNL